jgi:hypothetical protein
VQKGLIWKLHIGLIGSPYNISVQRLVGKYKSQMSGKGKAKIVLVLDN